MRNYGTNASDERFRPIADLWSAKADRGFWQNGLQSRMTEMRAQSRSIESLERLPERKDTSPNAQGAAASGLAVCAEKFLKSRRPVVGCCGTECRLTLGRLRELGAIMFEGIHLV